MDKKIIILLISIGLIYTLISTIALLGIFQPPQEIQDLMHRYDTFTAWRIYLGW